MLESIGQHFLDRAVELVKSGHKFVFVLDNIDWEEKAHDLRSDNQHKSVHTVAKTIVFDRIPSDNLSDTGPQRDLKTCNVRELVAVSDAELDAIRSPYRIILAKYLFEHFPEFRVLQRHIPRTTDCMYSEQTCLKSEVITMPILLKDEKKYSECVDVLDQLETWTYDIYAAAGMCNMSSSSSNDPSDVPSALGLYRLCSATFEHRLEF